jgi:anti-sigma B factor antagonist
MSLNVEVTEIDNEVVLALDGEMDTHTAGSVGERLKQVVSDPAANVVVDAEHLRFLDSSGISELLRLRQRTVDAGGTFTMRSASPTVRRVLEITGLLELLGLR